MFRRKFVVLFGLFLVLNLFLTGDVLAECNGVEIFKWNNDYGDRYKDRTIDGMVAGESICTVAAKDDFVYVSGMVKCQDNGKVDFLTYSDLNSGASKFEDPNYLCEDGFVGGGSLRKAELIPGKNCFFNYTDQSYTNLEASFNPYGINANLMQTVCIDLHTVGKCVPSGNRITVKGCGSLACKMNTVTMPTDTSIVTKAEWHADCVESGCTDKGITAASGKHACIPMSSNVENTSYKLKKCIIDRFDEGVDCPRGCGMGTSGDNECNSAVEGDVTCTDENITSLTYKSGAMLCAGKDSQTVYMCGSDGKFTSGKTCVLPQQCAVVSNSGSSPVADCINPEDLPEGTKILKISVSNEWNFFCDNGNGIDTGLGCIPYSITGMVRELLPVLFGISGGVAFLIMVYGFIMVSTSSGDEKKFAEAKQIVTSAIVGLLVVIFALFLYRLVVVNILKIPGIS